MRDADLAGLVLMGAILVLLVFVILAIIAGNIVNQLFAPVPSIAGPLGAAAALTVFVILLTKTAEVLSG